MWLVSRILAKLAVTKNPTMKDLDEGDRVHEDHDDHCSASGSEACIWYCSSSRWRSTIVP